MRLIIILLVSILSLAINSFATGNYYYYLGCKRINVEMGDNLYCEGNTDHGHAGIYLGIYGHGSGDSNNGYVNPYLTRYFQNGYYPCVKGRVAFLHQSGSSSSGGGKKFVGNDEELTISWQESGSYGHITTLGNAFFYNWIQHRWDDWDEDDHFNNSAPSPTTIDGFDRRNVVHNAYGIAQESWGYTSTDMIQGENGDWGRLISDIEDIRCDGVCEVAWDKSGNDLSCQRNLFSSGSASYSLKCHNNAHTGATATVKYGYQFEMCPIIQSYIHGINSDHTESKVQDPSDGYYWDDYTRGRPGYRGVPHIDYYSPGWGGPSVNLYMKLVDYGSDKLYVTIVGVHDDGKRYLIINGNSWSINDVWFFKEVDLDWAGVDNNDEPVGTVHNYGYHMPIFSGHCIIGNQLTYKYEGDFYEFEVMLVDGAGSISYYVLGNPAYAH